jgi:glycerophosphoryl diester phosphodiesterase
MGSAPENTLVSFRQAFDNGASLVEFDIHQSRDGEIVIIHDANLERTTNGSGAVSNHPLTALKALDAGCHFSPDGGMTYPYRGQKLDLPTLQEFFSSFSTHKAIIEIKQLSPSIVPRTLEIIRAFHAEKRVLLATEEDQIMAQIRHELERQSLGIATGFSYGEVAAFIHWVQTGMENSFTPPGQAFQLPCEYQGVTLVSAETVTAAHLLGLEMFVWTINDPLEMERLLGLGVDGIITDYPARLRALIHPPS